MPLIALLLSLPGFAALCLAMDRHHEDVLRRTPGTARRNALRAAGGGLLLLSFAAAVAGWGWIYGPVAWAVTLTGAALAVVGLLTWAPRGVVLALVALPPLAGALAVAL